jgi:hypothetical protein
MPTTLLKQLIERELQEGQGTFPSPHPGDQVTDQVPFEGELHVRQCSGFFDHLPQVLQLHGQHRLVMGLNQFKEFRVVQQPVVEVRSQRQKHNERATQLGNGCHQQVDEALSFPFRSCLREQFLKLVDQQHYFRFGWLPWSFCERGCQQVQATRGIIFKVFPNRFEINGREVRGKRKCEGFHRKLSRQHRFQIHPVSAARERILALKGWQEARHDHTRFARATGSNDG